MAELKLAGLGLRSYGDVIFNTDGAFDIGKAGATRPRNIYFTNAIIGTTALATPSALSATQFTAFASTVSGATLMGYGTTGDVTLKNRAGTTVAYVGPNTTKFWMAGDAAVAGALTAGAASFTTGTFSGSVVLGGDAVAATREITLNTAAGQYRGINWKTAGVDRWTWRVGGDAESGANAGTNLALIAFTDVGGVVGLALAITRSTMAATFGGSVGIGGALADSYLLDVQGSGASANFIRARDNRAQATARGGFLSLSGYNNDAATAVTDFARIYGRKVNSTTADTKGKFELYTDSGAGLALAITVSETQAVTLAAGLTVGTGFGCNTKAAQTAYASGGALAAYGAGANGFDSGANASALHAMVVSIRAALVANGILS